MNKIDYTKVIILLPGIIQLFIYLWMANSIFRAAKLAEDETAVKRFKGIFLLSGVMLVVLFITTCYSLSSNERGLNFLQLIYEAVERISLILCIGMPVIFLNSFLLFKRLVPWFWKNKSLHPPYGLDKK